MEEFKDGDLVTILSSTSSNIVPRMKEMIGKSYKITYTSSNSCIINHYVWSYKDIKKARPKEFKSEKFSICNLVGVDFKHG